MAATDTSSNKYTCSEPNCKFPVDSKCVEGLAPPLTCPHRSLITEIENSVKGTDKPPIIESPKISIHKGKTLNEEGCNSIMSSSLTTLIVLAGLKDCGKSTLLGSLMQLFQDQPNFANYNFAGSQTLLGFEEICFLSRMRSERDEADTARTVKGFDGTLHLAVKAREKNSKRKELLFTNISGEDFEQLSNSTEACKHFVIGKRAEYFVLFFDSDLLSQSAKRHAAKTNTINVLTGLLDAGMLAAETKIQIVFSKWDRLILKGDQDTHKTYVQQIKDGLIQRVSQRYNVTMDFFEIASRPKTGSALKFGHGLEKLFKSWVTPLPYIPFKVTSLTDITPKRPFSKFKYQTDEKER